MGNIELTQASFHFYKEGKIKNNYASVSYRVFWEVLIANEFKYKVSIQREGKYQSSYFTKSNINKGNSKTLLAMHIKLSEHKQ